MPWRGSRLQKFVSRRDYLPILSLANEGSKAPTEDALQTVLLATRVGNGLNDGQSFNDQNEARVRKTYIIIPIRVCSLPLQNFD